MIHNMIMKKIIASKNEIFKKCTISRRLEQEFESILIEDNFSYLNNNFRYPYPGERLDIDSPHFVSYGFGIKVKTKPSIAIKSIFQNITHGKIDCERAVLITKYNEILRNIGDESFDNLFKNNPLRITSSLPFYNHPRAFKGIKVDMIDSCDELIIGDWLYLENDQNKLDDNDKFLFSGEHVIVIGLKKYKKTNNEEDIVLMGFTANSNYEKMSYSKWNEEIFKGNLKGFFKKDNKIVVRRIDRELLQY